jgi:hypothetical protein
LFREADSKVGCVDLAPREFGGEEASAWNRFCEIGLNLRLRWLERFVDVDMKDGERET